ncbi:MAG: extensin family protein [Alphaproteobacteria bacterium]|nr:MAG: extensin family protein [Alphaproteobacteria bacterium]
MTRLALAPLLMLALAGCGAVPQSQRQSQAPASAPRPVAVSEESRMCLAGLGQTGSRFSPLPDRYFGGGCSAVGAVQLSAVQGDEALFGISNIGPVKCDTAQVFSGWARYGVDRAARQMLGSPLARIETMGSYSCRNVAGTSRLSAHSQAAAIDVSAFVLEDGRRIGVKEAWVGGSAAERAFLRTVHGSACKRFGTVLGPEYNAAHRDHFHLEQGGGGYCR